MARQMWRIARRSELTLAQLDGLFSLPSLHSIVSHPRLLLFVEVPFLVGVITALPLVTVFGPAAMVTSIAKPTTANVSVPTVDLFSGKDVGAALIFGQAMIQYLGPKAAWLAPAQKAMEALTPVNWPPPPPAGCSARCNYTITYVAPAMTCQDLRTDQIWADPLLSNAPPPGTLIALACGSSYNASAVGRTMTIAWSPSPLVCDEKPQGVMCTFVNATYRASVDYRNGTQSSGTEVVGMGDILSTDVQAGVFFPSSPEILGEFAMAAIVDAFTPLFNTTVNSGVWDNFTATAPPLFVLNQSNQTVSLRPDVSSLNEGLTSLLGNLTLLLTSFDNSTATVKLESQSERGIYDFHVLTLTLTYAIAFLLTGIVMAVGLRALVANGRSREASFSEFLVATADLKLDRWAEAASGLEKPTDEMMETRLMFDGRTFEPISARGDTTENSTNPDQGHDHPSPNHNKEVAPRDEAQPGRISGQTDQNNGA
jgi:hypothetical protein